MIEWKSEAVFYYKSIKFVGEGRTASVYRAVREDLGGHSQQNVALKVLKCATSVRWLAHEFAALSRIDSPHCVRVLGWDQVAEGNALVLEWIDGITLFDLAKNCALSPAMRDELLRQAHVGLSALHACGLQHGDLSPKNILVDREGRVRLIDFGAEVPDSGSVIGTAPYISLEGWSGAAASPQADLFSLGLIALDLETSFASLPENEECQARAQAVATDSGLLARLPEQRVAQMAIENELARTALAAAVRACLSLREQLQTAAHPAPRLAPSTVKVCVRVSQWLFACALLLLSLAVPVQARAPLPPMGAIKPATLAFRTQSWVQISVNGRDLGYAPIAARSLAAGVHHISWRTREKAGDLRLELASGEIRELGERDLIGAPKTAARTVPEVDSQVEFGVARKQL